MVFKTLHDGAVRKESVFVGMWLGGSGNYSIVIEIICYNDVLVSTLWEDRDTDSIISVHFDDVFHLDM